MWRAARGLHGHGPQRHSDLTRTALAGGVAVQRRRSAARKDGRTCSGRDGELSAGGRRAASGRLVLHGGVQLAGGVFVVGPSTSEASGSLALATREPRGFLPKMGADRLFTWSSDGDLARSDGPDL